MKKKKIEKKESKWKIELTEEQLKLISNALEFTSRFGCGQIGHTYLPYDIQELFYKRDDKGNLDWDEVNKRRDMYDALGNLIKTTIHPELSPLSGISYGVSKLNYSDNLYDIYKMINHKLHIYKNINSSPDDISYNVNSYFTKFGNLPNINVEKIDEE
jgi:hypothetical protein